MWPFENETVDEIELSPAGFVSLLDDIYVCDAGRYDDPPVIEKQIEQYPRRFEGFSARLYGPHLAVSYEIELGERRFSTQNVAEYDDDPSEVLDDLSLDARFPDAASIEEYGLDEL